MKKPSPANGGEIALSISISCEANFSIENSRVCAVLANSTYEERAARGL
jgi:hypothetical protein